MAALPQPDATWPDAIERFANAVRDVLFAYAAEHRRRFGPKPDLIAEFLSAVMDTTPRVLADVTSRGILAGFQKMEIKEYIQRAVASGEVIGIGRPMRYRLKQFATG